MKVSIIGASGKVGLGIIGLVSEQDTFIEPLTMVLYSPYNTKKVIGYLQDLEESLIIRNKSFAQNVFFLPSSDIKSIQNSDLIIISAGLFASKEEKAEILSQDASGRDIQSSKNKSLICDICRNIKELSPYQQ